jgi:phosphoribosylamine--glycine ligase
MRVRVLDGGGREQALAWRLRRDAAVSDVLAAPGNPGIAGVGRSRSAAGGHTASDTGRKVVQGE